LIKDIQIKKDFKHKGAKELGLLYVPSLEPIYSDTADYIEDIFEERVSVNPLNGNGQFTFSDGEILREIMLNVSDCKVIVEIGISRKKTFKFSSTHTLFDYKRTDCAYYGIDLNGDDISEYTTYQNHINLIIGDSRSDDIYRTIESVAPIDLLMIDGDHSVAGFLNDWKYSRLVRPGGYVVAHDLNNNPGPNVFYDAVDEKVFEKKRHFFGSNTDHGLAVFKKLI
jgi:hypothetical protein